MSEFKPLPPDSVISRNEPIPGRADLMFQCQSYLKGAYRRLNLDDENTQKIWTEEGAECEVLMVGSTWKKGKVRIKIAVEFCEDFPEPTFDTLLPHPEIVEDDWRKI
ncbi:KGK domain-containing protein [Pseudanabaena minima]|uniref:KGK domain-containing protein n=1 Tax=Pseudanabaena minima TaxID=890415 RepID=UPI003DA95D3F